MYVKNADDNRGTEVFVGKKKKKKPYGYKTRCSVHLEGPPFSADLSPSRLGADTDVSHTE